jgi:uncharacterized protein (DUF952 family)
MASARSDRAPSFEARPMFHVVERARWERGDDPYEPESLAREGFVHCSFREEVSNSARLYFDPRAALVVLELDPRRVEAKIVIASTPRGPMPHIHGAIARAWVAAVRSLDEFEARSEPETE